MEENSSQTPEEPKKSMTPMIAMGVVVLIALGGVGFLLMRGNSSPAEQEVMSETTPVVESAMEEVAPATIEIEGGSFYFKPNQIRVKAGQPVTVRLNSVDVTHDFVVDELNVRAEIAQGGTSSEVTFTPETTGEYEFYCSVGQHRANGMVGTLIVEE